MLLTIFAIPLHENKEKLYPTQQFSERLNIRLKMKYLISWLIILKATKNC